MDRYLFKHWISRVCAIFAVLLLFGCASTQSPKRSAVENAPPKSEAEMFAEAHVASRAVICSKYLRYFPAGEHSDQVRQHLKAIRCADSSLTRSFPKGGNAWLVDGQTVTVSGGTRMTLGPIYCGAGPQLLAKGCNFENDDPTYPLKFSVASEQIVYWSGRGVITSQNGTSVLLGYDCP